MQIRDVPKQENHHDCGLFAAMYAERFCDVVEGDFRLLHGQKPRDTQLLCEGPHEKFFMSKNKKQWFESMDVGFFRVFYNAAFCDLWTQWPPEEAADITKMCQGAAAALLEILGDHMPEPGKLWCAPRDRLLLPAPAPACNHC